MNCSDNGCKIPYDSMERLRLKAKAPQVTFWPYNFSLHHKKVELTSYKGVSRDYSLYYSVW